MIARVIQLFSGILIASALTVAWAAAGDDGIIKVKSAYPLTETIAKLKADNRLSTSEPADISVSRTGRRCCLRDCKRSDVLEPAQKRRPRHDAPKNVRHHPPQRDFRRCL